MYMYDSLRSLLPLPTFHRTLSQNCQRALSSKLTQADTIKMAEKPSTIRTSGDTKDNESQGISPSRSDELVTVEKGYEQDQLHGDLTPEEAHRALRKCDYRLIPLLGVLYLVAFIDRSNIGNARIAGMEEDLNLQGRQYNIAVTMFFVSYG